ncbi:MULTISPECIES: AAA family ATPase [Rhizobium/Agrobacterium group]|uniref:AAA family ATPase n=1 Tax=Rhizobium/Agrobacterium group TaxID=227290 RepID=UPI00056DF172|nr:MULTISPECIES: AAA family ATPase [Rhizobium/Agrobacterium group]AKC10337.1 shikimate kinase [Agrobacterium tumefaciens]AYM19481.1 shikimate kinase [Agrobacterium tumefaciens]AYM70782.1 shikimate kinase [Agrobacterium tumefaciens]NIB59776.1 AAA family ATPase [Agrobacterium tumefaciens]NSZ24783.1 AAA family ATPase [Agrobacterium tumefaciens]
MTIPDDFSGHILLLSGHPGSGKSTIAEALAHLPGVPKVHFHSDDLWGYIKHGRIDPWLPQSHQQNRMIMQIAADVAGRYASHGYFVILDGVVRPDWIPTFMALKCPLHYIVLRTTVKEAIDRCQARGGDSLGDPLVVADLHARFADLGTFEHHVLSVSGMDNDEALQSVINALQSTRFRMDTSG